MKCAFEKARPASNKAERLFRPAAFAPFALVDRRLRNISPQKERFRHDQEAVRNFAEHQLSLWGIQFMRAVTKPDI
jgi:hypothetical protein